MAPNDAPQRPNDSRTAEEMSHLTAEPMHPVEWWLIGGSLSLGIALLVLLHWTSHRLFPAP